MCKEQKINGQISMKFDRANNLLNEDIVKGISEEVVKESKNITDKSNKNKVNTKNSTNKNKRTKRVFTKNKKSKTLESFNNDIGLISEKEYTLNTGKTLNDEEIEIEVKPVKQTIKEELHKELKVEQKEKDRKSCIILDTTKKINNNFIQARIETDRKKKELLEEELRNVDLAHPYIKVDLLTSAELQLLHFMENNLMMIERVRILPKVRLGDLMRLDDRVCKDDKVYFKIACKHVDFAIVDKDTCETICVVELDDYTHETEKAKARDLFVRQSLYAANIPLYRVGCLIKNVSKHDILGIENEILNFYSPKCAYCGAETSVKTNKTNNYGHRFWSCKNFPKCKWSLDID